MADFADIIKAISTGWDIISGGYENYQNNQISEKNLQFQREALDWQKSAQQTTWNREDTAVQRRRADMEAAGLHPTLAAGSAASSSSPVTITAPQQQKKSYNVGAGEKLMNMMSMLQMSKLIEKTVNETQLINLQKDRVRAQTGEASANAATKMYDLNHYRRRGLPTNTSSTVKTINDFADMLSNTLAGRGSIAGAAGDLLKPLTDHMVRNYSSDSSYAETGRIRDMTRREWKESNRQIDKQIKYQKKQDKKSRKKFGVSAPKP